MQKQDQSETSLKRQQFSRRIRQQAIESYKQKIRKQQFQHTTIMPQSTHKSISTFNMEKITQLYHRSQSQRFKDELTIMTMLDYILMSDLDEVTQDEITIMYMQKIVRGALENNTARGWNNQNICSEWVHTAVKKVERFVRVVLQAHLGVQASALNSENVNSALTRTFASLLAIPVTLSYQLFTVWQQISQISHPTIARRAARLFIQTVEQLPELSPEILKSMLQTIANFQQINSNHGTLDFPTDLKFIQMISKCLGNFTMSKADVKTIAEILQNIITVGAIIYDEDKSRRKIRKVIRSGVNNRVKTINESSQIFSQLFQYLNQYGSFTNPFSKGPLNKNHRILEIQSEDQQRQVTTMLVSMLQLVGRVFSTDPLISEKVIRECHQIVTYLRDYLPFPVLNSKQSTSLQKVLTDNQQNILALVVFCLSNIVATSQQIVKIFLTTDIYRCLINLLSTVKPRAQIEIAYTIFNMLSISGDAQLAVMLESNIIECVIRFIKSDYIIELQERGVYCLKVILQKIQDLQSQSYDGKDPLGDKKHIKNQFPGKMSKDILKNGIQGASLQACLERLVHSQNHNVAQKATRCLDML